MATGRIALVASLLALAASLPAAAKTVWHYGDMSGASLGIGASLHGAVPFPANNAWNTDISKSPVDPNSARLIASIGDGTGLHPDFGSGTYDGAIIGIPYVVVSKQQPYVPIVFTDYPAQSDRGPYPVPRSNRIIEGYMPDGMKFGGDRHVLVIDRDTNRLFEMWSSYPQANGSWHAGSGAIFHLNSDDVRPTAKPGWTSADAAGLPIFPGLARYDEVAAGEIPHALRFTVERTREAYVRPANHWASNDTSPNLPPMGTRVRLKASYAIPATFSYPTRVILTCLKKYGMMVADNGGDWFISGASDRRWNNNNLVNELRQVTGANFEVVKMVGIVTPKN